MTEAPNQKQKKGNGKARAYPFTSKRRHYLEVGHRGFLATCNFREKDCVRECYNLLEQYAEQLYGPEEKPEAKKAETTEEDEQTKVEETDISDDLQKEIDAAQVTPESAKCRRFQAVDTGTKNCVFIRTTLPDPVELGFTMIKDIAEKKLQKSRFILRFTPIEKVCKADVDEISKAGDSLFDKYFLGEGKTFAVVYNKRYNNEIKRDAVIKVLADKVLEMNPKNKVDLNNPQLSIIVEIVKGKCCLSVVEGYLKYRKYNLVELAASKPENGQTNKEAEEPSDQKDEPDATDAAEDEGQGDESAEDDSSPENLVRDVPVGNKLKELLERKKSAEDEPNAKKFKNQPGEKEETAAK